MLNVSSMYQKYKKSVHNIPPKELNNSFKAIDLIKDFHIKFSDLYQISFCDKFDYRLPLIINSSDVGSSYILKSPPNIIPVIESFGLINNEHKVFIKNDEVNTYSISTIVSFENSLYYIRQPLCLEFDSKCNLISISYRYWRREYSTDSVFNFLLTKDQSMIANFKDELILIELFVNYNNPFMKEIFPEYHNHGAWVFESNDIQQRLELLRFASY